MRVWSNIKTLSRQAEAPFGVDAWEPAGVFCNGRPSRFTGSDIGWNGDDDGGGNGDDGGAPPPQSAPATPMEARSR
jgi:hypothetical protein